MDFCSIYLQRAAAAAVSQSFDVIHYHYSVSTLLMNAQSDIEMHTQQRAHAWMTKTRVMDATRIEIHNKKKMLRNGLKGRHIERSAERKRITSETETRARARWRLASAKAARINSTCATQYLFLTSDSYGESGGQTSCTAGYICLPAEKPKWQQQQKRENMGHWRRW